MNPAFFFPQTAQLDTIIDLFCLDLLTLEFLLPVFSLQLAQYVSIVFIQYVTQTF